MCVGLFSVTARAEEVTTKSLSFSAWSYLANSSSTWESGTYNATSPFTYAYPNATGSGTSKEVTLNAMLAQDFVHTYHLVVEKTDGTPILYQNDAQCNLEMHDIYYSFLVNDMSGNAVYYRSPSSIQALVYYVYGGSEYFDVMEYTVNGTALNLNFDITPSDDISKIEFIIRQDFKSTVKKVTFYLGNLMTSDVYFPYVITDEPTKEEGLLSGLIGWVKNIFNKISDIGSAIVELPAKIWDKISEGLKSLFVPSEEDLNLAFERFDNWARDKFGALYQAMVILDSVYDSISSAEGETTIVMPSTTINLPGNNTFTFGGWEVKVVPDGFEFLALSVKWATTVLFTLAFLNGMRKRYESVFGG